MSSSIPGPSIDLQERTLRVSNYSKNVTKAILNELFTQGGPVKNIVFKPGFSFVEFEHPESVSYCLALFDGIELFGERIQMAPKLQNDQTYRYLDALKAYEDTYSNNPLNWWNRFGDQTKQCPKHICLYTRSQSKTNYDHMCNQMYNNQMYNNQMYNNQNNQMYNQNSFNQKVNTQMMMLNQTRNQMMMPTSSTYLDNNNFSRQDRNYSSSISRNRSFNHYDDTDYRKDRDRDYHNRRSTGSGNNNNKKRNNDKYDNRNKKRSIDTNDNSNSKRVKKHQSF